MTPLEYAGYTMSAGDLIPLLPLLAVTASSIWVMMAIGVKRNYPFALGSTVAGLLIAGLLAMNLLSGPAPDSMPLLTMDAYAQFFTVLICALAIGVSLVGHNYWAEFDDQREEFLLLLLLATLGAVVLAGANHFASLLLGPGNLEHVALRHVGLSRAKQAGGERSRARIGGQVPDPFRGFHLP